MNIEKTSAFLRAVNGHHGADDVHHAEHVDVEIGADFRVGKLFDRADKDVACVVHGNVDAAETFGDGGDAAFDVGFVGERHGECEQVFAVADGCGELVGIARGGGDAVPCGEQLPNEGEPEYAGRAGYEPDWGGCMGIPFGVGGGRGFRLPCRGHPRQPEKGSIRILNDFRGSLKSRMCFFRLPFHSFKKPYSYTSFVGRAFMPDKSRSQCRA